LLACSHWKITVDAQHRYLNIHVTDLEATVVIDSQSVGIQSTQHNWRLCLVEEAEYLQQIDCHPCDLEG